MKLRANLPYFPDSSELFAAIADAPWSMLLDSGPADNRRGRYDILVSDPTVTLLTHGEETTISRRGEESISMANPLDLLRAEMQLDLPTSHDDQFFSGGALGYFGYDLGRRFERLPEVAVDDESLPQMAMGIYDWAVLVDHEKQQTLLLGQGRDQRTEAQWESLVATFSQPVKELQTRSFQVTGDIASSMDADEYAQAFTAVKNYIVEGDCYQINLAQRFSVEVAGDPWTAYCDLRRVNAAPFAAYLNLSGFQILSCSPERFIRVDQQGSAHTKPIKGTRPRSMDAQEDLRLAEELKVSRKDRAENLMIVDLLRNDFGKSCVPGSVRVPNLFEIESYATVHHLVSTVTGNLRADVDSLGLLQGCFPGGSITGAPKVRAMEIIESLEPYRRGVYCGSLGYLGFNGSMDTNIAIRTLTHHLGVLRFWAGGGIVHDSTLQAEYQETFDKAAAMLNLFRRS